MRPAAARTIAVCSAALLLLLFGTPLRVLWAHPGAPWWLVYALWGVAIAGLFAASEPR